MKDKSMTALRHHVNCLSCCRMTQATLENASTTCNRNHYISIETDTLFLSRPRTTFGLDSVIVDKDQNVVVCSLCAFFCSSATPFKIKHVDNTKSRLKYNDHETRGCGFMLVVNDELRKPCKPMKDCG